MIKKINVVKGDNEKDNSNITTNKDNKDIDQVINALIKENEILSKASKDNTYTPAKVLNELMKVLYIQRNQLDSLEAENEDLDQSISQLNTTIKSLDEKNSKIMLKTQSLAQYTPNRYTNSDNGNNHQIRYSFNPNGCLSFTNLKTQLRTNNTPLESESNSNSILTSSTSNFQRKTLKPINHKFFKS